MKKVSVKTKNRINGIKPILIISAIFASVAFLLLKEYSVISMFRPSNAYGHDAIVNPFGKLANGVFNLLFQIIVQLALTLISLTTIILLIYAVSHVMSAIIALIAIGVRAISNVKYSCFDELLLEDGQPTFDRTTLLTCKNLN